MIEFEDNGHFYRTGDMDVFEQFHVARKVSPIIGHMFALLKELSSPEDIIAPLSEALAKLSDTDSEYVLYTCAKYVVRKDPSGAWVKIFSTDAKRLMFNDIKLKSLIVITVKMITDNLGDFFPDLLPDLPEQLSGQVSSQ